MDQESFRKLLGSSGPSQAASTSSRGSLLLSKKATLAASAPQKKPDTSEKSAFKPRKVNNKFRDRAAERREGINEYAEVEGILEDFEKRQAGEDPTVVEERRKYLGGDSQHSILVKGLDFALLEQKKAQEAQNVDAEADAELDAVFNAGSSLTAESSTPSSSSVPSKKKKTRQDLLAELKQKRSSAPETSASEQPKLPADAASLEKAKRLGKFRPIGAPPPVESRKSKTGADEPLRKKKKNKVAIADPPVPSPAKPAHVHQSTEPEVNQSMINSGPPKPPAPITSEANSDDVSSKPLADPEPAGVSEPQTLLPKPASPPLLASPKTSKSADAALDDDDDDIFGGAGEYKGIESDGSDLEDEEEGAVIPQKSSAVSGETSTTGSGRWFGDDPDLVLPSLPAPVIGKGHASKPDAPPPATSHSNPKTAPTIEDVAMEDASSNSKLRSLLSSSGPSVRAILEADEEAERDEKRLARKLKRKQAAGGGINGGGEVVDEDLAASIKKKKLNQDQKLQRDYQQYTSYVEKRGDKT